MNTNKWMPFVVAMAAMFFMSDAAYAADDGRGLIGVGAGLAIGIAALGGGMGQGRAAAAAYEAIARNPQAAGKLNTPFFVGLALIESLVIAFFLQGKI